MFRQGTNMKPLPSLPPSLVDLNSTSLLPRRTYYIHTYMFRYLLFVFYLQIFARWPSNNPLNSPYHSGSQDWLGPQPRDRKIGSRVRIWEGERGRQRQRETGSHGIFVFSTGVKYKQHLMLGRDGHTSTILSASPSVLRKYIGCWYWDTPGSHTERVNTLLMCGLAEVEGRAGL